MLGRSVSRGTAALQAPLASTTVQQRGFKTTPTHRQKVGVASSGIVVRPGGRATPTGVTATIFGTSGFIGRYVTSLVGQLGCQVVVPYRGDGMSSRHLKLAGDLGQIVPTPFDMFDEESIYVTMSRSNVVVNCMGSHAETKNFNHHDSHVKCAYRIAKAAKTMGVPRFIHLSATGATLDSDSSWLRSKAEGELAVKSVYPDATILRLCTVFGAEDHFINPLCEMINNSPFVPLVEDGVGKVQPTYVRDVAQAVVNCLTLKGTEGKTYELGGPETLTYKEVTEYLMERLNQPGRIVSLPAQAGEVLGNISEKLPFLVYNRDELVRQRYDSIVSPDALTFADLAVTPKTLDYAATYLLHRHMGDRHASRFGTFKTAEK